MTENEKKEQEAKSNNNKPSPSASPIHNPNAEQVIADAGGRSSAANDQKKATAVAAKVEKEAISAVAASSTKQPQYVIKYRYDQSDVPTVRGESDPCRPTSIIIEVSLPEMSSAKGIELDVLERLLTLESKVSKFYVKLISREIQVAETFSILTKYLCKTQLTGNFSNRGRLPVLKVQEFFPEKSFTKKKRWQTFWPSRQMKCETFVFITIRLATAEGLFLLSIV